MVLDAREMIRVVGERRDRVEDDRQRHRDEAERKERRKCRLR